MIAHRTDLPPVPSPVTPRPISAPGKALLIGEYAVLEGAPALVTAVDVRAVAHRSPEASSSSPFTRAARAHAAAYLAARALPSPGPLPLVDTAPFAPGQRKLGLGSSAAATAAVLGYHLHEAGLDLRSPELLAELLALARLAHAEAQGGGSGADVAASVLGGALIYRGGPDPTATPTHLPAWLHVAFVDAGAPAQTGSFVAQVREAAACAPAAYAEAMAVLRAASERFLAALGPTPALSALTAAVLLHNDGLRRLQSLSGAPILTPTLDLILREAAELGLPAKPSGAGGGDLVVVFAECPADLDRLADRLLRRHGLLTPRLAVAAPGLRVDERPPRSSRLPGFFRFDIAHRREAVAAAAHLPLADFAALDAGLAIDQADHMIENVIGTLELPLAIATNFRINGVDVLVPMCVEEASVVAAASNAAKMIRAGGGFVAASDPPWMIAQIQLCRSGPAGLDPDAAVAAVLAQEPALLRLADSVHPRLLARGGGARAIEARALAPDMLAVHVVVDCRDAMGANLLNSVAEILAPRLGQLTGWSPGLRILSNLADRRRAHARCRIPPEALAGRGWEGADVVDGVVMASRFAELDPYRAATHNKGIMNGVDAVVLATGNDWRAMEAGAHAYASETGRYRPLATWRRGDDGWLEGAITLPAAVGMVGGATHVHPSARLALQILGCESSAQLGQVLAAAGLASNLAALRALATEGIQRGHMALHARTLAVGAGAQADEIDLLAHRLVESGEIKHERAITLLHELRANRRSSC